MSAATDAALGGKQSSSWLTKWTPEDEGFWKETGSKVAWRTLTLTTITLVLSFATWFVVSALVVRLPGIGFKFSEMELFWLAAMPGLAGGTLRIIHTFLIPIFGTRSVVSVATLIKVIPCVGLAYAMTTPTTPYWVFLVLAFLAGMGGGDFSSYMPSTSLFFPKKLQGAALGIQAGVGNFGVSLTQFVTPWVISFAAFGGIAGAPQVFTKGGKTSDIWLQNAVVWYVPLLVVLAILCWIWLRSVPVRASFREQLDIFKDKHTWFCTVTYVMTFGSFSGFSAAFPLMIKSLYGGFPNAPDPLKYAFYGPLIGSASRVLFGFVADKVGGGILTQISGFGLIVIAAILVGTGAVAPTSLDSFGLFVGLMLALFFFTGMGNASTFRQYPVIFSHNPRQGAQVLGWTGAVAAYGPLLFSTAIGAAISSSSASGVKSAGAFFVGAIVFYMISVGLNWFYYVRKGCERPS
ncbi:MAG: MFS transporter [Polyangiaceae bacterium]|nr:MFS transporter [Polyangiaceae bacterium]